MRTEMKKRGAARHIPSYTDIEPVVQIKEIMID